MIARAIWTAFLAGLFAGSCLFLVQRSLTLPLIRQAQTFERVASEQSAADPLASEPMRSLSTLLGDAFVGIGFGLILTGAYARSGKEGWLAGLGFGAAGFAVFQAAPAMIVPPATPGMELAPLLLRQVAWLTAAISAIVGLVLICKAKGAAKFAGIMIVALPSIVFRTLLPIAPAETSSRELAALDRVFILRTLASMLMFWLILGITTGYLFGKRRGTSRSSSRWTDSGASRD